MKHCFPSGWSYAHNIGSGSVARIILVWGIANSPMKRPKMTLKLLILMDLIKPHRPQKQQKTADPV